MPQTFPANTLAVNPYARPESPIRSGDTPRGAQLLSSVRQAPGGGRDLYASPDGNVYRRQNGAWYQRGTGGNWRYYAAAQGTIDRNHLAAARAAQAGGGMAYRPTLGQARGGARPNTGFEPRAQQVAGLERAYYARTLAQMRGQNARAWRQSARPVRGGGRRR